jgi:flagellar hook-length control protein FliK
MPAINAAANPVNAVISPSAPKAGGSAASANTGDRPFATVLAEQAGKAPKSPDKEQAASTPAKATTAADSETDAAAPTTAAPLVPDVQTVIAIAIPVDVRQVAESGTDEETIDARVQTATDLIQAVLLPNGATTAQPEAGDLRKANTAAALATTAAGPMPTPVTDAQVGADPRGESIADMRLAIARSTSGETAPEAGSVPANLAAAPESFALPTEAHGIPASDLAAVRSETGMAQAAASIATAVPAPVVAAVASQPRREYQIVTPVGNQHWETAVGNSLVIMSGAQQSRAELILTPPQFGRIEVSISMKGDEATAFFVSANPAVRDALESALPRLREVLADAGITLGQTQVGAEPQGQSASERQNSDNASRRGISGAVGDGQLLSGADGRNNATHRVVSRALVDTYA